MLIVAVGVRSMHNCNDSHRVAGFVDSVDLPWQALHARQHRAGVRFRNASKCNEEVTGWLRRKRLNEGAFLLRHLEINGTLAPRSAHQPKGLPSQIERCGGRMPARLHLRPRSPAA